MKRVVEDSSLSGLESLIGERVTLFAANYIYTGKLAGVDDQDVELHGASIVYETGELTTKTWKDAQALPGTWFVRLAAIESFGILK